MVKTKSTMTNQRKITTASSMDTKMRKADPYATWERVQKEDGRPKASRRVKGKFDGACYNCGKTGHRSRDCWRERSNGKGKDEQKGKGGYTKSEHGYNGGNNNYSCSYNHYNGSHKGGGKFVNVCDSQSFAPQPQAMYQNPGQGNRLMTTRWNGHV